MTEMGYEERVALVHDLNADGLTVKEIQARTGFKRATVYQYLTDPTGEKNRERKERYRQPCVDCGALLNGSDGFAPDRSVRCVPCAKVEKRRMANRRRHAATQIGRGAHSEEALLDALRTAHGALADEGVDGPLTKIAYDYVRATRPGLGLPSSVTILNRLAGWSAAVERAGLRPGKRRRENYVRASDEDCLAAVREAAEHFGHPPTYAEYERWSQDRPLQPSAALIRLRLGSWIAALDGALDVELEEAAR